MLRLRHALEWYAASRLAGEMNVLRSNGNLTPPIIFVSASDVAGEGELKLLQHLHAAQHWAAEADHFRIASGLPAHHPGACPPSFLLVGPDADLLLLGLAAGVRQCDVLTTGASQPAPQPSARSTPNSRSAVSSLCPAPLYRVPLCRDSPTFLPLPLSRATPYP